MKKLTDAFGREYERDVAYACVGSGWRRLVETLMDDLFAAGWDGRLYQIKEKFGGLRFYAGSTTRPQYDLIVKAERASVTICETCGMPGKICGEGWQFTACALHSKAEAA